MRAHRRKPPSRSPASFQVQGDRRVHTSDSPLQRKAETGPARFSPADYSALPGGESSGGRPLDGSTRGRMESVFDANFKDVRVHTGSDATRAASAHDARALTVGNDIAFGAGEYRPGTMIGDALLAHELAHTMQQAGAPARTQAKTHTTSSNDPLERDADESAMGAVVGLWSGFKNGASKLGGKIKPRLKTGLRISRCSKTDFQKEIKQYGPRLAGKVKQAKPVYADLKKSTDRLMKTRSLATIARLRKQIHAHKGSLLVSFAEATIQIDQLEIDSLPASYREAFGKLKASFHETRQLQADIHRTNEASPAATKFKEAKAAIEAGSGADSGVTEIAQGLLALNRYALVAICAARIAEHQSVVRGRRPGASQAARNRDLGSRVFAIAMIDDLNHDMRIVDSGIGIYQGSQLAPDPRKGRPAHKDYNPNVEATDCISWIRKVLERAYGAQGRGQVWKNLYARALKASGKDGIKGTEIIKLLQQEQGWKNFTWVPDVPKIALRESVYNQIRKTVLDDVSPAAINTKNIQAAIERLKKKDPNKKIGDLKISRIIANLKIMLGDIPKARQHIISFQEKDKLATPVSQSDEGYYFQTSLRVERNLIMKDYVGNSKQERENRVAARKRVSAIRLGFIAERAGFHTGLILNGQVYEIHWGTSYTCAHPNVLHGGQDFIAWSSRKPHGIISTPDL